MASVFDVASYIMAQMLPQEQGEALTAWKLQKLVYYAQAWATVWDDDVLFPEPIEAWANGPVCRALYDQHRGKFKLHASDITFGDPNALTENQRDSVNRVLDYYGKMSAQYLSDLTHSEAPWREAREGLAPGERGNNEISPAAMSEYYGGLLNA